MTNMLPSKQKYDSYVKMGLLQERKHKTLPLSIYVYSILTNYERLWNVVTKSARGIVFDDKDRCIVRCLPKFFNEDEPHATCEMDVRTKPVFYDKLDGSLIQVVNDPEYGLIVTSKGSFHSDQVIWATQYLEANGYSADDFREGLTYVFELIHPDNRIVLDYGDTFKLYLITVIDIKTGAELNIYKEDYEKFERIKVVEDVETHLNGDLVEGVVTKVGEHRYKIKTGEYVRLHRLVTEFTPKKVWEALSNGDNLEFQNMPEEFQAWLDSTIEELQTAYDTLHAKIMSEYERTKDLGDKELGLLPDVEYKPLVFSVRNGFDISPFVWRHVKPIEEGPIA